MSRRYGARELLRTLAAAVEDPLTALILDGAITPGSTVRVGLVDGEVRLTAA
jgi:ATP-dependent Clp protease ATP-binding subunit ClpA